MHLTHVLTSLPGVRLMGYISNSTHVLWITQFDNSDYDALWDGRGYIAMHKPNGDIPRDISHNCELSNWLIEMRRNTSRCNKKLLPNYTYWKGDSDRNLGVNRQRSEIHWKEEEKNWKWQIVETETWKKYMWDKETTPNYCETRKFTIY